MSQPKWPSFRSKQKEKSNNDNNSSYQWSIWWFSCMPCAKQSAQIVPSVRSNTNKRPTSHLHLRFTPLVRVPSIEFEKVPERSTIQSTLNLSGSRNESHRYVPPLGISDQSTVLEVDYREYQTEHLSTFFPQSPHSPDDALDSTLRRKPQVGSSSHIITTLEDEIFLFVTDIAVKSNLDINDDRLIFDSSTFPVYFNYSGDHEKLLCSSTNGLQHQYELISFLRTVVGAVNMMAVHAPKLKRNASEAGRTSFKLSYSYLFGTDKNRTLHAVIVAASSLSQLLNNYQDIPKEYRDSLESLQGICDGNCFSSVDKALIVTDIFVVAIVQHLDILMDGDSFSVCESLNSAICSLFQSILHIGNFLHVDESVTVKFLWCQLVVRCCRLVISLTEIMKVNRCYFMRPNKALASAISQRSLVVGNLFAARNSVHSPNGPRSIGNGGPNASLRPLSDLVNILQALCSCINLVKVLCGAASSGYYASIVIYWETSNKVMHLIKMYDCSYSGSGNVLEEKSAGLAATVKPSLLMLHSRSFNSLHMTAPSLQELHYEVNCIAAFKYTLNSSLLDDRKLISILQWYCQRLGAEARETSEDRHSAAGVLSAILADVNYFDESQLEEGASVVEESVLNYVEGGSSLSISTATMSVGSIGAGGQITLSAPQFSFRMRIIFIGLMNLFSVPDMKNISITSYNIPDKIDWITAIAEFLFVILAQAPLGGSSNSNSSGAVNYTGGNAGVTSRNSIASNTYKNDRSESSDSSWKHPQIAQRSTHLITLAPFVASLLLNTIYGTNIPPSIDWIFWGLAKRLGTFTDYLRRNMSTFQWQGIASDSRRNLTAREMSSRRSVTSISKKPFKKSSIQNSSGSPKKSMRRTVTKKNSSHSLTGTTSLNSARGIPPVNNGKMMKSSSKSKGQYSQTWNDDASCISNTIVVQETITSSSPIPVIPLSLAFLKNTSEVTVADDRKLTQDKSRFSPRTQSADISYAVDDTVDALCVVQNGSKRWYPGKIIKINFDGTYNLLFTDGELRKNITFGDMRRTKKRQQQQQQKKDHIALQLQPKLQLPSLNIKTSEIPKPRAPKSFLSPVEQHSTDNGTNDIMQKNLANSCSISVGSLSGESIPFLYNSSPEDESRKDILQKRAVDAINIGFQQPQRRFSIKDEEFFDEVEVICSARIEIDADIDAVAASKSPYLRPHLSDADLMIDETLLGEHDELLLTGKSSVIPGTGILPSLSNIIPALQEVRDRESNRASSAGNNMDRNRKKRGSISSPYELIMNRTAVLDDMSIVATVGDNNGGESLTVRSIHSDVDGNEGKSSITKAATYRKSTGAKDKAKGTRNSIQKVAKLDTKDSIGDLIDGEVDSAGEESASDDCEQADECDSGENSDDEHDSEDELRIFEIPSVFDTVAAPSGRFGIGLRKNAFSSGRDILVPRMKFEELNTIGSLPHNSSSFSLSGALLSENNNFSTNNSSDHNRSDGSAHFNSNNGNLQNTHRSLPLLRAALIHNNEMNNQSIATSDHLSSINNNETLLGNRSTISPKFQEESQVAMSTGSSTRLFSWSGNGILNADGERFTDRSGSDWGRDFKSARTANLATADFNNFDIATEKANKIHQQVSTKMDEVSDKWLFNSNSGSCLSSSASSVNEDSYVATQGSQHRVESKNSNNSNANNNTNKVDPVDQTMLQSLLHAYGVVTGLLLQRSVTDKLFLDYSCCASGEFSSPRSIESMSLYNSSQANVLFNVREYLEVGSFFNLKGSMSCGESTTSSNGYNRRFKPSCHLAELSYHSNAASLRLCKLLNGEFFKNCLRDHMDSSGVKIGEGGFGTVFRVACPESCGRFKQNAISCCFSCHKRRINQQNNGNKKSALSKAFPSSSAPTFVRGKNCCCGPARYKPSNRSFAVKRIPRERSAYDSPLIYDLFNEITSLELLSGNIGICGLEDFGVSGSEYWLVMENGGMNLLEWRLLLQDELNATEKGVAIIAGSNSKKFLGNSKPNRNPGSLCESTIALLLSLYLDILYILKSVHAADIAHFDVKCNNFILRDDPRRYASLIHSSHRNGCPSGVIFLADFGESVPYMSVDRSHPLRKRCRGTITIQSPEMLCVSDSLQMSTNISSSDEVAGVGWSDFNNLNQEKSTEAYDYQVNSTFDGKKDSANLKPSHSLFSSNMSVGSINSESGGVSILSNLTDKVNEKFFASISNASKGTKRETKSSMPGLSNARKLFHMPDKTSDVWSLGCLLIELLTSVQLFNDRAWTDMFVTLCMERFRPIPLDCMFKTLDVLDIAVIHRFEHLANMALRQDPVDRATVDVLMDETYNLLEDSFGDILMFSSDYIPTAPVAMNSPNNLGSEGSLINSSHSVLSPLKLSRYPSAAAIFSTQHSVKLGRDVLLDPIVSNNINGNNSSSTSTSTSISSTTASNFSNQNKVGVTLCNAYRALRGQRVQMDLQMVSLGALGDVYLSFEGFDQTLRHFDGLVSMHHSINENINISGQQQFDILHKIGSIDESVQSCEMLSACETIARSFLRNKLFPNRLIVWVRVVSSEGHISPDSSGGSVAVSCEGIAAVEHMGGGEAEESKADRAKQAIKDRSNNELFDLFASKSSREVLAVSLSLNCSLSGSAYDDSLDLLVAAVGDVVKQVCDRLHKQPQPVTVIVSVEPSSVPVFGDVNLSVPLQASSEKETARTSEDSRCHASSNHHHNSTPEGVPPLRSHRTLHSNSLLFDRQSLTVAAAVGAILQAFSVNPNTITRPPVLRRLLPCCDHHFDGQIFDFLVDAVSKRMPLPRK